MPASQPIQSVVRALAIVDAVSAAPEGLSVSHLAETLQLNPTTVHNFVRTLVNQGVLTKSTLGNRHILGPRLWNVLDTGWRQRDAQRAEAAVRHMARTLPEATVVFARFAGGEVAVELRMSPDLPGQLQRPAAQRLSPYTSACCLAVLAFADVEQAAAYRRRFPFMEYGGHVWPGPEALTAFLEQCRRRGYVRTTAGDDTLIRLAAPWPTHNGGFAALGLSMAYKQESNKEAICAQFRDVLAALLDRSAEPDA